jgi:uncharacterized damage-inducible protein DinB
MSRAALQRAAETEHDMTSTDDRETVMARYLEGPARLEAAIADLGDAELDACPAQGGWTIRQIVHHLADGDDFWKVGIKAALGDTTGVFTLDWYWSQPQEVWAERWAYARRSVDVSMALLGAIRAQVAQLLDQIPDGWDRSVEFRQPDGETVRLSVAAIVAMQADHVEHHLRRIAAIRGERDRA